MVAAGRGQSRSIASGAGRRQFCRPTDDFRQATKASSSPDPDFVNRPTKLNLLARTRRTPTTVAGDVGCRTRREDPPGCSIRHGAGPGRRGRSRRPRRGDTASTGTCWGGHYRAWAARVTSPNASKPGGERLDQVALVSAVVGEQPRGQRAGRPGPARGDHVAQLEHQRLDLHVGQPGRRASPRPSRTPAACGRRWCGRGRGQPGRARPGRPRPPAASAPHGRGSRRRSAPPAPSPSSTAPVTGARPEVTRRPTRPPDRGWTADRWSAEASLRRAGARGRPGGVLREVGRVPGQVDAGDRRERLSGRPEPVQRLSRPRAALERRAERVRPAVAAGRRRPPDARSSGGDQLRPRRTPRSRSSLGGPGRRPRSSRAPRLAGPRWRRRASRRRCRRGRADE